MLNFTTGFGRSVRLTATAAGALMGVVIAAPSAQAQQVDTRWQAIAGCWVPEAGSAAVGLSAVSGSMVCIAPVANSQNADVATISNRKVVRSERINIGSQRAVKTVDNCTGWESGTWSADGRRVFQRSEFLCPDNLKVTRSEVFAISSEGALIQVQGQSVAGNADARVVRFQPADVALAPGSSLADSAMVTTVPVERTLEKEALRAAAGAPASPAAVLDVAKNVDEQVAQAWLTEVGQPTRLSAKELVTLADGGMSGNMIDLMVALSYPERFRLQAREIGETDNSNRPTRASAGYGNSMNAMRDCSFALTRYEEMSCLRASSMYGYGYRGSWNRGYSWNDYFGLGRGYGNYYYGQSPIIIVSRGNDDGGITRPQGRAVKGQGYTRGTGSSQPDFRPTTSTSSGSGSSSGGSSSGGGTTPGPTTSGGSSGGDTGRTAKPRPPQN